MMSLGVIAFELKRAFNKSSLLYEAYQNEDIPMINSIKARFNASAVYRSVISFFQLLLIIKSISLSWQTEYSTLVGYVTLTDSVDSAKCILE
mmetsp:Transcript_11315/g.9703  ORF Transcript_11315/g.9703 Transcript_11315/m.9703 type:complete len:92 (-) Transcript_11315:1044-1319(-)